jgi:formamidopyrimidine-DNA glycosylase
MRGQLLLEEAGGEPGPYHCVTLRLSGNNGVAEGEGGEATDLRFYDMWTWGEMRALTADELAEAAPALAEMGPEPLEPDWGGEQLAAALAGRRTAVKPTLLDQTVVAGVGNIYADESLFRAGINPRRPAKSLSAAEADRLAREIRAVLTEAVEGGGTTSDEYVDLAGAVGRYTPRVYDRGGEPCPNCGTALTRIKLGGRGTVFCGGCQPPAPAAQPGSGA